VGTVLISGLAARYASQGKGGRSPGRGGLPVLAVNFKSYETAFGERGLAIAIIADRVADEYRGIVETIVAVPATEIVRVSEAVEAVKVYGQHADPVEPGAHTGSIPLEALREAGAAGTLLNHSEKKLRLSDIDTLIRRAAQLGMETLACADTPTAAAAVAALSPTMLAVEPPELIGTGTPVSRAKPEVITSALKLVRIVDPDVPLLAGAGISSGEDAEAAVRLGAHGVLVASAVMKAPDPEAKLRELAEALARAWEKHTRS
jgi:triosephosphate isomerase